jgi:hypothetical protein
MKIGSKHEPLRQLLRKPGPILIQLAFLVGDWVEIFPYLSIVDDVSQF